MTLLLQDEEADVSNTDSSGDVDETEDDEDGTAAEGSFSKEANEENMQL